MIHSARTPHRRRRSALDFAGASKLRHYKAARSRRAVWPWVVCLGLLAVLLVDAGLA